jgi:hypothetical protein
MVEENLMTMCCVCKKIKIDGDKELWLSEKDNPELYQEYLDECGEAISDGYCPEDLKKRMQEVEGFKRLKNLEI